MKYSEKRERMKQSAEPWLYLLPFMVFFIVFIFYPAVNVLILSFKQNYSHLRGTFDGLGFENYRMILEDGKFRQALLNTFLYVIFVVPVSTALSTLAAQLLNRRIRGIAIFQTAFFMPMVTSVTAVGLVWRFMYNQKYGVFNFVLSKLGLAPVGWVDDSAWSLVSLVIFGIWNILPFTIILLMAGLQNIDEKYYIAARIDGARPLKIFTRITIPLLSPTIFLVLIVNTISCFKVFSELYPLFNGKPGPYYNLYTVVYYIRYAMVEKRKYGYAAAASMIFFLFVSIFTFLQLRLKSRMR
ncbi:MAG TPA: sugar ABC transporter permease, partial [Treponema sp.]|nr:sugar ABC transporter permease [Treponema sp.]